MNTHATFLSDDGDGAGLYVFSMPNGDWYIGTHPKQRPDGELPMFDDGHVVRCSTSGSQLEHAAVLCVALLHDIGTGDQVTAHWRSEAVHEACRGRTTREEDLAVARDAVSDATDGRPDFEGFIASLRSEEAWLRQIERNAKADEPSYQYDRNAVLDLADRAERLGKTLGFL